jgi:hypothetical protein
MHATLQQASPKPLESPCLPASARAAQCDPGLLVGGGEQRIGQREGLLLFEGLARSLVGAAASSSLSAPFSTAHPDENTFSVDSQKRFGSEALRNKVLARADLVIAWSGAHRSGYGAQYAWRDLSLVGNVNDTRSVAPWAQLPIVDAARPQLDIAPALTRNLLSLYAEHTWRPVQTFSLEGGGRAQYDVTNLQASGSARLAAALSLPTLTVLKLSGGAVWQPYQVPLALDPVAGNRQLKPERSVQLIAGLEQPLPFEALVRLEGWAKWLGDLVVNPDTRGALDARLAAGLPAYTNAGFGHAYGIDGMLVGRTRHFSYTLGLGVLSSVRTNPLAVGVQTYPVQWEQRFTRDEHHERVRVRLRCGRLRGRHGTHARALHPPAHSPLLGAAGRVLKKKRALEPPHEPPLSRFVRCQRRRVSGWSGWRGGAAAGAGAVSAARGLSHRLASCSLNTFRPAMRDLLKTRRLREQPAAIIPVSLMAHRAT